MKNFVINIFIVLQFFSSMNIFAEVQLNSLDTKVFTDIYERKRWGNGSGPGSYPENTEEYRKLLQEYFNDPRFTKIVDYGCGDFQMMKLINIPDNKTYVGIDVVKSIIDDNMKLYGKNNVKFYIIDDFSTLKDKELLYGDLLVVKDVFIHWSNSKIQNFLDTVLPNFKYALITNDIVVARLNQDIQLGDFRAVDIQHSPFNVQNLTIVQDYLCPMKKEMKRVYLYTNPKYNTMSSRGDNVLLK